MASVIASSDWDRKKKKKFWARTGSGILNTLALLERPAQALKVGIRETGIGDYDETPEGFFAGAGKGWRGEDEVRTQEFMSDEFRDEHPWLAGIGGFIGDVLTDPLTYAGGAIFKVGAAGAKALPGAAMVGRGAGRLAETDVVQAAGRAFNVPIGREAKIAKYYADQARAGAATRTVVRKVGGETGDEAAAVGPPLQETVRSLFTPKELKKELKDLDKFFRKMSKATGKSKEELHGGFVDMMEGIDSTGAYAKLFGGFKYGAGTGVHMINKWSSHLAKAKQIEKDFAFRTGELGGQADMFAKDLDYFPRIVRDEYKERTKFEGAREGGTGSLGYQERAKGMVDSLRDTNIKTRDRLGIDMFHENPVVALGVRLDDHHKAIQKKWALDQISDAHSMGAGLPLLNVGKYVRRNERGDPEIYLYRSEALRRDPVTGDIIPESQINDLLTNSEAHMGRFGPEDFKMVKNRGGVWVSELSDEADQLLLRENGLESFADIKDWRAVQGFRQKVTRGKDEEPELEIGKQLKEGTVSISARDALTGKFKPKDKAWPEKLMSDTYGTLDDPSIVDTHSFFAPKEVSKAIDNHLNMLSNNRSMNQFLKFYDTVQGSWKGWSLAVRPAYHVRNVVGNMFNAYTIAGVTNPVHFMNAFKMQRAGHRGKLSSAKGFNGIRGESMESIVESGRRQGVVGGQYIDDVRRAEEDRLLIQQGLAPFSKTKKAFGQDNPAVQLGFAAGEAMEANARWGVYLAHLKKVRNNPSKHDWIAPDGTKIKLNNATALKRWGVTPEEAGYQSAARKVKEALFDYSDLSPFERDFMKRAAPFYTWTRKNIPAQLKHLVLNPQRAEKLHLAKEQFEFAGGRPEYKDIAPFWGNRVPIFFGRETDGVRKMFTTLNTLPLSDVERMFSPKDLLSDLVSPLIKEPLEQLFNYDTFRKRAMKRWKGEKKDFLGIALPARLWHLAQLLVPITEINRLNPGDIFGAKTVDPTTRRQQVTEGLWGVGAARESNPVDIDFSARLIRFLTGGRVYDVNMREQRMYYSRNLMSDASKLERELRKAMKKGEQRKIRELLSLLRAMQRQEETDPFLTRRRQ